MNMSFLLGLKKRKEQFVKEHPKFLLFIKGCANGYIKQGNIIEISVKNSDNKEINTTIELTKNDVETLNMILKRN